MTPHQLWDARDGLVPTAAKVITLTENDVAEMEGVDIPSAMEAAIAPNPRASVSSAPVASAPVPTAPVRSSGSNEGRMVQLGAYANQAAAQQAWGRLGPAARGLTPVFEPVTVNGRDLVRLKVRAQSQQAQALCAVAAASDAWCMKGAG